MEVLRSSAGAFGRRRAVRRSHSARFMSLLHCPAFALRRYSVTPSPQPSPQPKSDLSDFGHLKVPNSGKPEFGWGEGAHRVRFTADHISGIHALAQPPIAPSRH